MFEAVLLLTFGAAVAAFRAGVIEGEAAQWRLLPSLFLVQLALLYFIHLARRAPAFSLLGGAYTLFLALVWIAGPEVTLVRSAPVYLGVGVVILWCARLAKGGKWEGAHTAWVAGLVLAALLLWVLEATPRLRQVGRGDEVIAAASAAIRRYTPWLALAGLCLTLTVKAVTELSLRGLPEQKDYVRRIESENGAGANFVVGIVRTLFVAPANAVVAVVNMALHAVRILARLSLGFAALFVRGLLESILQMCWFVVLAVARVFVPMLCLVAAATLTVEAAGLADAHLRAPTWQSAWAIYLRSGVLLPVTVPCAVLFFAFDSGRRNLPQLARGMLVAYVTLGLYGVVILAACNAALVFGAWAASAHLGVRVPLAFGPFFGVTVLLLIGFAALAAVVAFGHRLWGAVARRPRVRQGLPADAVELLAIRGVQGR